MISAITWVAYTILSEKSESAGATTTAWEKVLYVSLTVVLILTPVVTPVVMSQGVGIIPSWSSLLMVTYLGLFASVAQVGLFQIIIRDYSPSIANYYLYIQTPVVAIAAVILLGETLTAPIVIGAALVLASAALIGDTPPPETRKRRRLAFNRR